MKNWYIVQSYSSFENKVAQNIKKVSGFFGSKGTPVPVSDK